jgi:oligoendopeptidase F
MNSDNKKYFVNEYIKLLEAGGSGDYIELLKVFELNPKDEKFWDNGMRMIAGLIDMLEVKVEGLDKAGK